MTFLSYLRDERGGAAVELAFIGSIIAGFAVTSYGVWESGVRKQNMTTALESGAEYFRNGYNDPVQARNLALSAWMQRPSGGTITTSTQCRCASTTISCDGLCAGIPPAKYISLTAQATKSTAMFNKSLTDERVVRVR